MPGGGRINWCFTQNNPVAPHNTLLTISGEIRYAIWQLECVTTQHLQGYVQFNSPKCLGFVTMLVPHAHWEVARGSFEDNHKYCSKRESRVEGTSYYEIGVPMVRGQRTDLMEIQLEIKDGATDEDLAENHFSTWTRNYHAFQLYRNLIQEKRDWVTQVIVLTGPTGCGKSYYCHTHTVKPYRQTNKNWFSGYEGQDDVIFDEFYGSRFSYSYFLLLLDRYDMRVETKGGEVNFKPRRIWITSNKEPAEWYSNCSFDALERRISYHRSIMPGESREAWIADVDDAIAFLNTE